MGKEERKALGLEDMEKSFNDSLDNLRELLGPALKKGKEDVEELKDDDEEDDEEEEEDEKGGDAKPAMKSLENFVAEDDAEASAAMDIEPFLRSLVKGIDAKFEALNKSVAAMQKRVNGVEAMSKAQVQYMVAAAEMQKAMRDTVEKIGETPVPSRSVLRKSGDRFEDQGQAPKSELTLSRAEILDKALHLRKLGKLNEVDVTKIEGRLNKNIPLEERYVALIKSVQ